MFGGMQGVSKLASVLLIHSSFALAEPVRISRSEIWPARNPSSINRTGQGVGIVFSPDLVPPETCQLYERLGFRCFMESSWDHILNAIAASNRNADRVSLVILEVHGSGGNGLKVQESAEPSADRSYASIGVLEQRLGDAGVRYCVIDACNAARLVRSTIREELVLTPDRLVLPAREVLAARPSNPTTQRAILVTRQSSGVETISVRTTRDLSPETRLALQLGVSEIPFGISDLLAQLIVGDCTLRLVGVAPTEIINRRAPPAEVSARRFQRLTEYLHYLASSKSRRTSKRAAETRERCD